MAAPTPAQAQSTIGTFCHRRGAVITPSDSTVYPVPIVGLRVGTTAGDVAVVYADDDLADVVTIPNVQVGETIPGVFKKVMSTGTDAVGITGGW